MASREKSELINSVLENDTVKKLKKLEEHIESNFEIKNKISDIIQKQKKAISSNNQESIAGLLNELKELQNDLNILEYLNVQEEINTLMLNIKNIIESNLKG